MHPTGGKTAADVFPKLLIIMNQILKLEEAGMFALSIILFTFLDFKWWIFPVFLLAPDLSMFGYMINNRIGAFFYNIFHHKGIAVIFYAIGWLIDNPILYLTGIILFAHASLDRILGYGLKYSSSFKNTHLGHIGVHPKTPKE